MDVLLSTAYLPPIQYFVNILKADNVYIDKHETYIKQTYRNRCCIYSQNGKQNLIIPVNKPNGNKTITSNIIISNLSNWQQLHWRAYETAYNSSPYFLYYKDDIYPFFIFHYENLFEFNSQLLCKIMEMIGIKKQIRFTTFYEPIPNDKKDLRYTISPKNRINTEYTKYTQVFCYKSGFIPNLSILDLIFNMGTDSLDYLNLLTC